MRDKTIENSHRIHLAETRDHVLTIKHDDGLYRHLVCRNPKNSLYWFEIVTWPGHLSIGGDLDGYVFARVPDMFEFFTLHGDGINPGYWGEKVVTRSESCPDRDFSSDMFKAAVVGEFWSQRDRFPGESRELFRRIREDVIEAGGDYAESAHAALREFRYRSPESGKTFEFGDWWEMNLTDWSPQFLRACWAIVWGIREYRKAKAPTEAPAEAVNRA